MTRPRRTQQLPYCRGFRGFRGRGIRGLTLIELLAVVVIISLVASVSLVSLAAGSDSARLRATASAWRDLDAHARLLAQSQGILVMELNEDRTSVMLRSAARRGDDDPEKIIHFPDGVTGELVESKPGGAGGSGSGDGGIRFDRLGRSTTYEAILHGPADPITWRVNGLTGLIVTKTSDRP